jgi:hypothetical protein
VAVMDKVTKSAASTFQHDDSATRNAQVHGHNFRDRM